MTRKTLLIAVAAILAAGAAHAEDRASFKLKTGDLNLASPKDVARLYDRVTEAAGEVCGRGPLSNFVAGPSDEFLACQRAVVDSTLSQVHAPLVVALREQNKADGAKTGVRLASTRD